MPSLAARLATGDPSAFAELYDACADRLHGYLLFRLRNPEAAADVLQETFLRLVRAGRKLRKVENIEGYVFRVAHNESQRWLARHKRHQSTDVPEIAVDVDCGIENAEEAEHLLAQLDRVSREILELKFYGGLTFAAIAAALRLPPGTVATHYRRALEKLRHGLEQKRP
ncbi:MAG: sigma-70 family RNA polymerase sigma factor [Planctomycetes bacterium]|nr:sigma-70 family RNA polymerase sigma factor [Planctomycetota bacterium]